MKLAIFFLASALTAAPPLTLPQALQEALANNLDLSAERMSLNVAAARQITAALKPNPVLTVAGQTLDLLYPRFNAASPAGPNQFNAHTDFIFERGDKRNQRIALAAAERNLTELDIRELSRRILFDVQTAFVDLQQSYAALALAEDNLAKLRGIVDINQARVNSGDLASVELERSKVAAQQYETAVEQSRLQLAQNKTRLQRLIGRQTASPDFEIDRTMRRETLTEPQEAILTRALAQRPDLLSSRQAQVRSKADLNLQLANGKVDYTIGAEYTFQRAYGMGGSSLGFSFSVPIPVYNKNQGEIARAGKQTDQAGARITALERSIASEVELAFRQYQSSRQLLGNIEGSMLTRARSVRDITEYSYRRGEASLVEFLDAQRAFNDVMQSYTEAQANFARSLYLIDAISGATTPEAAKR